MFIDSIPIQFQRPMKFFNKACLLLILSVTLLDADFIFCHKYIALLDSYCCTNICNKNFQKNKKKLSI